MDLECNLAGLRAASSALESAASNPPVEHYTNGVAAAILAPPQAVEPYQPPKRLSQSLPQPLPQPVGLPPPRLSRQDSVFGMKGADGAPTPATRSKAAELGSSRAAAPSPPPAQHRHGGGTPLARMWAAESSEEILQSIVGAEGSNNWQAVANFIEGASVFAVSRLWSDLIAAFGFGLQPIPYCGSFLEAPCTPTAPSGDLFLYALGCVPAAALAKHLAEYFLPERGLYGCLKKLVPTMSAYVVGWAVGGAFLQMLKELEADHPELCDADGSGCSLLSFSSR